MDLAFCRSNGLVNLPDGFGGFRGYGDMGDQMVNGGKVAVAVVVMMRGGSSLFLILHQYPHMGTPDPALFRGLQNIPYTGDSKAVQFRNHGGFVRKQFQQGGGQHVACRAHAAVQIKQLHFLASM